MWLKKLLERIRPKTKYTVIEKVAFIREDEPNNDPDKLSLIDIKAAIAKQGIPVSELYTRQDLAANRDVVELVHTAETKARGTLEKEIVILKKNSEELQSFKDRSDVISLVDKCGDLTDKDAGTVQYIRNRMKSGRGVHFGKGLTEDERQEKVNEAIKEELSLIQSEGITFVKPELDKDGKKVDDFTNDPTNVNNVDMTDPAHNTLIAGSKTPAGGN